MEYIAAAVFAAVLSGTMYLVVKKYPPQGRTGMIKQTKENKEEDEYPVLLKNTKPGTRPQPQPQSRPRPQPQNDVSKEVIQKREAIFARVAEEADAGTEFPAHPYFFHDSTRRSVMFVNRDKGIKRLIVADNTFVDFPGTENPDVIMRYYEEGDSIPPWLRFGSSFEYDPDEKKCVIYWTIQPDGMYYADEDGFGGENQMEITLYIYVDENGDYEGRFRIESVGVTVYKGTSLEDEEAEYNA